MLYTFLLLAAALATLPLDRMEDRQAIRKAVAAYARHGAPERKLWSETLPPILEVDAIRFVSADEAVVEAADTSIGIFRQTLPVMLRAAKQDGRWRVWRR